MRNIVFTGGGTAGHIMPNIALIEKLPEYKIYYLGSSGMEKEILKKYNNINFIEIETVKLIRSLTLKNLLIPYKMLRSIKQCKRILKEINPCLIFSKGGYVSLPVCLAGSKLGIPIITHESDLTLGLANKIIAKKSKYLCCSFRETAEKYNRNAIFTGSPIRKAILNGNKLNVSQKLSFTPNKPIITVIGGSLGAQAINEVIWDNIDKLSKKYSIIHITGKNNINKNINKNNYKQIEFARNIEDYFAISDIVISRAGSNTIFELLSIHKPMILIPLPKASSRGDQILNAENFQKNKIANLIYQENLNIDSLINEIDLTLKNKNVYISNMKKYSSNIGTDKIIELIKKTSK